VGAYTLEEESVGGSDPKPPLFSATGASPQTPSYCSHILLQLQKLKGFVGEAQKYFATDAGLP